VAVRGGLLHPRDSVTLGNQEAADGTAAHESLRRKERSPNLRKTFFCGVALPSNNALYVIADGRDKQLLAKRLPNQLPLVRDSLEPFRKQLQVVAVESAFNRYWLVDGLREHGYPVVLANPSAMEPGRFDRLVSRGKTADAGKPKSRRLHGRELFRFEEGVLVLDRNPIWMTPGLRPITSEQTMRATVRPQGETAPIADGGCLTRMVIFIWFHL
jgi:hypothetical protein